MFHEEMLTEKINDDIREEHHRMQLLKENSQKQHSTLAKQTEKIRPKQIKLFDYLSGTWNEMLNTSRSASARRYF